MTSESIPANEAGLENEKRRRYENGSHTFFSNLSTILFFTFVTVIILYGWLTDLEDYITAEEGLGYALGVTGGSMMLILLLYPLRKRVRSMRRLGSIPTWFRIHMFCGIFGPILILYHSNFHLGSANSNVALFCMLTVAGSGLIGRYLYAKIHYGLYGSKATFNSLSIDVQDSLTDISPFISYAPDLNDKIMLYENKVLEKEPRLLPNIFRMIVLGISTRWTFIKSRLIISEAFRRYAKDKGWSRSQRSKEYKKVIARIKNHLSYVRKIAGYTFYERMFALWHVLHIPLFIMLVIAGTVHVIAVHMF